MAFNSYRPSRSNTLVLPAGWQIDVELTRSRFWSGFDASVFVSAENKAVIAFRGTDGLVGLNDWFQDGELGIGDRSAQLDYAIEVVADAIAK